MKYSEMIQQAIVYVSMVITLIGLGLILNQYPSVSIDRQVASLIEASTHSECSPSIKSKINCTTDMDCVIKADRIAKQYNCNYSDEI